MSQTNVTNRTSAPPSSTPRSDGLIAPARTYEHQRTLISWPVRTSVWDRRLDEARREYAAVAEAIAPFERVTMIANPGQGDEVRELCGTAAEVIEIPIDDSWVRDNGPIFLLDGDGHVAIADFAFNAYGGRFLPHDNDDALPAALAEHFGMRRYASSMVLEGGGFTVDGEGTLISTEQSQLHPNRNPEMSREQVEAEMREYLGVEKVIWLAHGLAEDRDTDGHSDNVVQFVRPGVVLAQVAPDRANPNWDRLNENLARLRSARDAAGRALEVIEMAVLPYTEEIDRVRYPVPYTNFYPVNGAVIAPALGAPGEEDAFGLLAAAFPGREVIGVESRMMAFGGGGVGCVTQQMPAGQLLTGP